MGFIIERIMCFICSTEMSIFPLPIKHHISLLRLPVFGNRLSTMMGALRMIVVLRDYSDIQGRDSYCAHVDGHV